MQIEIFCKFLAAAVRRNDFLVATKTTAEKHPEMVEAG